MRLSHKLGALCALAAVLPLLLILVFVLNANDSVLRAGNVEQLKTNASVVATLYEKLFVSIAEGTPHEAYDKLVYNMRTRAFFEALRRGLINSDELEKAATDLEHWIERDRKRFLDEQRH